MWEDGTGEEEEVGIEEGDTKEEEGEIEGNKVVKAIERINAGKAREIDDIRQQMIK